MAASLTAAAAALAVKGHAHVRHRPLWVAPIPWSRARTAPGPLFSAGAFFVGRASVLRMRLSPVLCLAALLSASCASTLAEGLRSSPHDLTPFQGVPIDLSASEYVVLGDGTEAPRELFDDGSPAANPYASARKGYVSALSNLFGEDKGRAERARVKVAFGHDINMTMMFPCLVLLVLVGCPVQRTEVAIDLSIEVRGKVYSGHGSASELTLFYTMARNSTEPLKGQALGAALDDALQHVTPAGGGR